jgi:hypothetical protein
LTADGIFTKKEGIEPINVSKIPIGIYFLEIVTEGKLYKGKFLQK